MSHVLWVLMCLTSFQESDLLFPPTGEFAAQVKTDEPKDYFIVFVTTNCSPCERMKTDCIPVVKARGHQIRTIDMGMEPQWGVTAGPETWRCRNGVRLQRWTGYVSPATLLQSIQNSLPPPVKKVAETPVYRSEEEKAAERHLLNEHGIRVSGLSLAQMEVIHDNAHGGTGYHFPGRPSLPRMSSPSSSCPTGTCPTNNSGFFFRRRR